MLSDAGRTETVRISSLSKAIGLLRLVAGHNASGVKMTQLARQANINTATVHRILSALVDEGMLSFDPYSKLYYLGVDLFTLVESGETSTAHAGLYRSLRPVLERVSEITGDTTFLSVYSQGGSFCIDKVVGAYPVSINTLDTGARRPLGVGAASLALLSVLPPQERSAIIDANRERYTRYGHLTAEGVESGVRFFERHGYAFNNAAIIPEVSAVGIPVFDTQGHEVGAISLGAVASRLKSNRRAEIVELIRRLVENQGFRTQR